MPRHTCTVPPINRLPIIRPTGAPVWHGVTPTRFATALPPVQGPVNARAQRASRRPLAPNLSWAPQFGPKGPA